MLSRDHDPVTNNEGLYVIFLELKVSAKKIVGRHSSQRFGRRIGGLQVQSTHHLPAAAVYRRILASKLYASAIPTLRTWPD